MTDNLPPLPSNLAHVVRRIRACESEDAAQVVFEHALNAYARAALAQAQSLPDGWKLVPVEMTHEMLRAPDYRRLVAASAGETERRYAARQKDWEAILLAAPAQPVPPSEQAAFEDWLYRVCPSGDVTEVQRQWEASSELADWLESQAKPVQTAADDLTECKAAYESQFRELHALKNQRDALLKSLRVAVRQNEHDMLMTGEELRAASAAIAAAEKGGAS